MLIGIAKSKYRQMEIEKECEREEKVSNKAKYSLNQK